MWLFQRLKLGMFIVSAVWLIPRCMGPPGFRPVGTLPRNGYPVGGASAGKRAIHSGEWSGRW